MRTSTRVTLSSAMVAALILLGATDARAAIILSENFDDITTLPGSGWSQQNLSTPVGMISWFQGNPSVFGAQSGATTSYIGANFNNTTGAGTISNWLITPTLALSNGDTLQFYTRTVDPSAFPDRLQVRLSTNGASTTVADFSTLLLDINPTLTPTGYPNAWTLQTIVLSGLGGPTSGRIAFQYFVTNGGPTGTNSDYIGIDTVSFDSNLTAVPEPSSLALFGMGFTVACIAAARRRRIEGRQEATATART